MLEWIGQGNNYYSSYPGSRSSTDISDNAPVHPNLSAWESYRLCLTSFPRGILQEGGRNSIYLLRVGYDEDELLPGLYEYRREGDNRVEGKDCNILLNVREDNEAKVQMTYGEFFTVQFYEYHGKVGFEGGRNCHGALYRIGD